VGDDRIDSFDDLFEPFELEDGPPPEASTPPPAAPAAPAESDEPVPMVSCPSCGTSNPAYNRHCEACGARLGKGPLPVASPPMVRATPGGRALGVLVAIVLVVALIAFVVSIMSEDAPPPTTLPTTAPSLVPAQTQELQPSAVRASSELNTTIFAAENLLDGDPDTEWQDLGLQGEDATLRFEFEQPVAITHIEFTNIADDDRFRQNYRIRGYRVTVDDLPLELSDQLQDVNEPQRFDVASFRTTVLTIEVTSTYPAESIDDGPPYTELALADVRFFGTIAE
jgi:hypothetical protein